jgi:hypothetical protein
MTVQIEEPGPPVTPQRISEVEADLGVKFPDSYRMFLLKYNGGLPTPDVLAIEGAPGSPTDVQVFFGINRDVESSDLQWNKQTFADRLAGSCLPIACDSGGNLFCLAEEGRVIYVDLEAREPTHYFVAKNFDAFMEQISE